VTDPGDAGTATLTSNTYLYPACERRVNHAARVRQGICPPPRHRHRRGAL